jgi:hypothetical protein
VQCKNGPGDGEIGRRTLMYFLNAPIPSMKADRDGTSLKIAYMTV